MQTTLFLEIGYQTVKIAVYHQADEQLHFLDITGGYGKRAIPLQMHYISDDDVYLIGEDAINYEVDETTIYYKNVLNEDSIKMCCFINGIIGKVQVMIPNLNMTQLVMIYNGDERINAMIKGISEYYKKQLIQVQYLFFVEAVASWYLKEGIKNKIQYHYFDDEVVHYIELIPLDESHVFVEKYKRHPFLLGLIDSFYINYLNKAHKKEQKKTELYRLYNDQMTTLYSQMTKEKDVSVYSSLEYPPIRIKVAKEKVTLFLERFEEEFINDYKVFVEEKERGYYSGAYNKKIFVDALLDMKVKQIQYIENSLLEGGYYYFSQQLDDNFIKKNMTKCNIGVLDSEGRFIKIDIKPMIIKNWNEINLVMTHFEKKINIVEVISNVEQPEILEYKTIKRIEIENPSMLLRMKIMILVNEEGQVEEVRHELRNL